MLARAISSAGAYREGSVEASTDGVGGFTPRKTARVWEEKMPRASVYHIRASGEGLV